VIGAVLVWMLFSDQEKIMTVEDRGSGRCAPEPVDALVEEFRGFLGGERGLASETVRCYGTHARAFLAWLPQPVDVALAELSAGLVTGYVVEYCRGRNVESAKAMVTALRSLLRFLHVTGRAPGPLTGAVPAVASWRLAGLPRRLSSGQVEALIEGCNTGSVVGVRDRALLVLLARLGLRTAEAAAVRLEDVDWRSGQILIRGKGNRVERLPLPQTVGEALAEYVTTTRPRCASRSVFLTVRGRPPRPLTAMAVRQIVARACTRAGLPRLGAHRLRHTLASDLLRAGNSLPQVGQVLRHRSQLSTAIYAKVDTARLRDVARPWPGRR
jgi:integrase/recombinase XerD